MADNDTWGQDPQVRYMRLVFSAIENVQKGLLESAGISPLDERLRSFRETALVSFEKCWGRAIHRGFPADEGSAATIYGLCLARAMSTRGIDLPLDNFPRDERLEKLVDEVLS